MPLTKTAVLTGPQRSNYLNFWGHGNTLQMNDGTEIFLFGGNDTGIDSFDFPLTYKINLVANGIENQPLAVSELTVAGHGQMTLPDDYSTGMLSITKDNEDNIYFATMSGTTSTDSTNSWINIYKIHAPAVGWRRWTDQTSSAQNSNSFYTEDIQIAETAVVTNIDNNHANVRHTANFGGEGRVFQNEVVVEKLNSWRNSMTYANNRYIHNITWFRSNHIGVWCFNDRTSAGNEYYTVQIFATKNQMATKADRIWTKGQWVSTTVLQYYSYGGAAVTLDDYTQFGAGEFQGAYICGQTYQNSSNSYVSHVVNTWRFIPETGIVTPYGTPIAVGNSSNQTNSQLSNRYHKGFGHVISYLGRYNSNFYMAILGPDSDTTIDTNIRAYILGTNGTSTLFNPKVLDAVTYFVHDTSGNRAAKYRMYQSNDETNTNAGYRWERTLQNWTDSGKLRFWQCGNDFYWNTWYLDIDYTFGATNSMTFSTNGVKFNDIPSYGTWNRGVVNTINKYPTRKDTNMYGLAAHGRLDINPGYTSTVSTVNEAYVFIPYSASSRNQWWNKLLCYTLTDDGITTSAVANASASLISPSSAVTSLPKAGGVTLRFTPNIRTGATGGSGTSYYGWPTNVRGFRLSANDGTTTTYYNGTTLGGTETTIPFYFNGITRRSHEEVVIELPGTAFTAGLTYTFKIAFVTMDGSVSAYSSSNLATITFTATPTAKDTPTAIRFARVLTTGYAETHVTSIDNKSLVNRISINNPTSQQGRFSVKIGGFPLLSPTVVPAGGTLHIDSSHIVDQGDKVLVSGPVGGSIYISGTEGI